MSDGDCWGELEGTELVGRLEDAESAIGVVGVDDGSTSELGKSEKLLAKLKMPEILVGRVLKTPPIGEDEIRIVRLPS